MLGIDLASVSTILLSDFGNVLMLWYFLFFILFCLVCMLFIKRDDFYFLIVNFPCSNILAAPAYVVISISLSDIPELVVPTMISLIEGCC